ncbi:hypothetical protein TRVA0_003S01992 [Trichomonascus vanleenenianus]|uniref:uncharacterized protein n=1 Tax=Trichomonascus vanleenenianus TaxID=2268995 RepID=UPI003ECA77C5
MRPFHHRLAGRIALLGRRTMATAKPIEPAEYMKVAKDYVLRRSITDTTLLPHSRRALHPDDPIGARPFEIPLHKESHGDPRLQELTLLLTDETVRTEVSERIWESFELLHTTEPNLLKELNPRQCTQLLRRMALGPRMHRKFWARHEAVFKALKDAGHTLTANDYARMIDGAFQAREYYKVDQLWAEVEKLGVARTTALWNAYIRATCNGYPWFWERFCRVNRKTYMDTVLEPPVTNDTMELFKRMVAEGCMPDLRTHDLLMFYFAKNEDLGSLRTVISSLWGEIGDYDRSKRIAKSGSLLAPDTTTLTSIIHSFAYCGELQEGLDYCRWLAPQYGSIRLQGNATATLHYWTVLLKWAFVDNKYPLRQFDGLWAELRANGVHPTFFMFYLRLLELELRNRTSIMEREIDSIFETPNVWEKKLLASVFINRTVKKLIRLGRKNKALTLVDSWVAKDSAYEPIKTGILNHLEVSGKYKKALTRTERFMQMKDTEQMAAAAQDEGGLRALRFASLKEAL